MSWAASSAPDDPEGWQVVGPSDIPYGFGKRPYPVRPLSVDEIKVIYRQYADAARRAHEAGYEWLEMHFAHGYLGASFYSPLANRRTDEYGGSLENRARFLLEALDAVREVWPENLPLTARLDRTTSIRTARSSKALVEVVRWMTDHGLDMIDLSMGAIPTTCATPSSRRPRRGWSVGGGGEARRPGSRRR